MGRTMQLLLPLLGLVLSSRVSHPQLSSGTGADLRTELDSLRKKFGNLEKKFVNLKKKLGDEGSPPLLSGAPANSTRPQLQGDEAELKADGPNGPGWKRVPVDSLFATLSGGKVRNPAVVQAEEGSKNDVAALASLQSESSILKKDDWDIWYSLWKVDKRLRPCIGTMESVRTVRNRRELPKNGLRKRLSVILSDVLDSGVPPNTPSFAVYDAVNKGIKPFQLKFVMDPRVHKNVYLKHHRSQLPRGKYQMYLEQSLEDAQKLFEEGYYGDRLLKVYQADRAQEAIFAGHNSSRMLRVNDDLVVENGAVLLFRTPHPLLLKDLTDDVMDSVEAAVLDAFKDYNDKPEPFWYSICLLPVADHGNTIDLEEETFLIGSKMDEATFARALPAELQERFLAKNKYEEEASPKSLIKHAEIPKVSEEALNEQHEPDAADSSKEPIPDKHGPNKYYGPKGYRQDKYKYF